MESENTVKINCWKHLPEGHSSYEALTYKGKMSIVSTLYSNVEANTLQWRHNEHDGVSNHQPNDCLLNHLFRRSSKKTSKLRVTGLCVGNSPVTGEFPAQRASNA